MQVALHSVPGRSSARETHAYAVYEGQLLLLMLFVLLQSFRDNYDSPHYFERFTLEPTVVLNLLSSSAFIRLWIAIIFYGRWSLQLS